MSLIQQGLDKGLIHFDEGQKYITYVCQNKRRNWSSPEEKVQAEAFLKLVLLYGYLPEQIEQFVPVKIGSDTREADIVVYSGPEHSSARIVVECKKADISEREFGQAVAQAFSYAATGTVRAKYFWVTSGIKDACFEIPEEEPRQYLSVPDIPQNGASRLARFKYAKGGGTVNGQRLFELETVTEDELTRRFRQAHDSLWGGGQLNPSDAFDELDKLIFCKIWDERKPRKPGEPYDFQIIVEERKDAKEKKEETERRTSQKLFERINALYDDGRRKDPEVFKEPVRLSPEKLRTVVGYLESVHLGSTDLDSKGRAFETFLDSFFRGDFGQYFTPRPIVRFIVDALPITHSSVVLDTSCGSGGFLLHALDKVRRQADEFSTRETIAHFRHWHDFAEKNLYGIKINEQIARTAKMNMILHDDGHTNVIAADGLLPVDDIRDKDGNISQQGLFSRTGHAGFAYGRFDFIITNPPFGASIKLTEQAYMQRYSCAFKEADWLDPKSGSKPVARDSQSTEILFFEQCCNYLAEGGYLAIVIPDGILTNSSLQYVRDWIEAQYRIIAVVSLPQTAFQATGAGVKSSVLVLKKHRQETSERIQRLKTELQDSIKAENSYFERLEELEREKKRHIKELPKSEAHSELKKEVSAEFREKADELRESLNEQYLERKRQTLADYPVFMAIAEDIGYDGAGKPTACNELEEIGRELARFIAAVEQGKDSFFSLEPVMHFCPRTW